METTGKRVAIRCLHAAIEGYLKARDMSRQVLAEDVCQMSEGNFSKVVNGNQGDFLALLHDKLPTEIRRDYYERMTEQERADPLASAIEQMHAAMWRVMRLSGGVFPDRASAMAKAELPVAVRKVGSR